MAEYEAQFEFNRNTLEFQGECVKNQLHADLIIKFTPDRTSQLINDSGYITIASVPTKLSQFINDAGFITSADIPTKLSQFVNDTGFITTSALIPLQNDIVDIKGDIVSLQNDIVDIKGDIVSLQNNKVDKVEGKGLSTNDFTNQYKELVESAVQPSDLATVATTGDYDDLLDKPTIGSGVLTIQVNGSNVQTFNANQTTNVTANIEVPDSATWGNITGTLSNQNDLQQALNAKQNTISDLSDIRSGAAAGATALQPSDVINNTSSTTTNKPLSANMGKSLQDQVDNLKARGRFLALWNCSTGLAQSNPPESPYLYKSGDYFIVGTVGTTNYKPTGSSYTTGIASTVVETAEISVDDVYYYDGTQWRLQVNTQKTLAFANIAGDPYDNTNLASALNAKQDELTEGTGIDITNDVISNSGVRSVSSGVTNGTISVNTGGTSAEVSVAGLGTAAYTSSTDYATSAQGSKADSAVQPADLSGYVPYSGATGAVDLNAKNLKNISNLAVNSANVDSNEKILSVGQNRIVTNNQNGLFISSTTSQTRKGMYGVPMALEIQFNSNNQAYSYPLGFHDMNTNNQGGQFLFTSFSQAISAASAGDVMVENDKGGLIFNTGNSKSGSKMRFTVGNWAATPQLTLTANSVGVKNLNPNSNYALDVTGDINASTDVKVNGVSIKFNPSYDSETETLTLR